MAGLEAAAAEKEGDSQKHHGLPAFKRKVD